MVEALTGLADFFSRTGWPAGILILLLFILWRVCGWIKPWVERLLGGIDSFITASTESCKAVESHVGQLHEANKVTHHKLDQLHIKIDERLPPR